MITIDGTDVSAYLLKLDKEASVCQFGASLKMTLDLSCPMTLTLGQEVQVSEQGLTFTGWVADLISRRVAWTIELEAYDCQPLLDYLIEDNEVSAGEDVAYWINYILDLCGMQGEVMADTGYPVPTGYNFRLMTAREALHSLIGMSGEYFIESDGAFKARVRSLNQNSIQRIDSASDLRTMTSDNWIRNRVAVFSSGSLVDVYASGSLASELLDPEGLVQSYVICNSLLDDPQKAEDLVERALEFFKNPLQIKSLDTAWASAASLGQRLFYRDTQGLITQYQQRLEGAHLFQHLELDTRCHAIWGWNELETRPGRAYVVGSFAEVEEGSFESRPKLFRLDNEEITLEADLPFMGGDLHLLAGYPVDSSGSPASAEDTLFLWGYRSRDLETSGSGGLWISETSGSTWVGPILCPYDVRDDYIPYNDIPLAVGLDRDERSLWVINQAENLDEENVYVVDRYVGGRRYVSRSVLTLPDTESWDTLGPWAIAAQDGVVNVFCAALDLFSPVMTSQFHLLHLPGETTGSGPCDLIAWDDWARADQGDLYDLTGRNAVISNYALDVWADYVKDHLFCALTANTDIFTNGFSVYRSHNLAVVQRSANQGADWESNDLLLPPVPSSATDDWLFGGFVRCSSGSGADWRLIYDDVHAAYVNYVPSYQTGGVKVLEGQVLAGDWSAIDPSSGSFVAEGYRAIGRYDQVDDAQILALVPDKVPYNINDALPAQADAATYADGSLRLNGQVFGAIAATYPYQGDLQVSALHAIQTSGSPLIEDYVTASFYYLADYDPLDYAEEANKHRYPMALYGFGRESPCDSEDHTFLLTTISKDQDSRLHWSTPRLAWSTRPPGLETAGQDEVYVLATSQGEDGYHHLVVLRSPYPFQDWTLDSVAFEESELTFHDASLKSGHLRVLVSSGSAASAESFKILNYPLVASGSLPGITEWSVELNLANNELLYQATGNDWGSPYYYWGVAPNPGRRFALLDSENQFAGAWYDTDSNRRGAWVYTGTGWVQAAGRTYADWIDSYSGSQYCWVNWYPVRGSDIAYWSGFLEKIAAPLNGSCSGMGSVSCRQFERSGVTLWEERQPDSCTEGYPQGGIVSPYRRENRVYFHEGLRIPDPEFFYYHGRFGYVDLTSGSLIDLTDYSVELYSHVYNVWYNEDDATLSFAYVTGRGPTSQMALFVDETEVLYAPAVAPWSRLHALLPFQPRTR